MSVDATVRHVFGYDGSAGDSPPLQLADETTLVYVSGHTLHFTCTTRPCQHFLLRTQPRKLVAFDFNWKTCTFAIAAREPEATISLYSYPDKKLKDRLKSSDDHVFEYSSLKFSRCGRRLLSIRPAPPEGTEGRDPVLCVWDVETLAPVPGCEHSRISGPARFASFDPVNINQFIVGGDNGLQVWKIYAGKTAASSLLRPETVTLPAPLKDDGEQPTDVEWEEKRVQFSCHAWLPRSRFLVANLAGSIVTVMAPTPSYAKAYVGTRNGKIFEVRTIPCASFPTGPACDSTVFTPFGGTFSADALIATGGMNGFLALWSLRDCRQAAEINIAALFSQDPATIGALTDTNSRPGTSTTDLSTEPTMIPPVVITALASRPGDPIVMIGDRQGRLRSLCTAKIIGGGGKIEVLPQHSVQLLPPDAPLDLLAMHPTHPVLLVSSTHSIFTLQEPNERIVDIQWNSTGNSSSSSLTLMCFSSRGRFYSARYQAPPQEDISVGSAASGRRDVSPRGALQIVPKVIAFGEAVLPMCSRLRFLAGTSSSMMIATSPDRPELTLLKYRDVLRESTDEISILSKVLIKRAHARGISAIALFPRVLHGDVELLVTGGMDGTVTLWTLAAVTGRYQPKVSESESKESGVDGCVFLMEVRMSAELHGEAMGLSGTQSSDPTMNPLYMNVVSTAKYDDLFQPEREQERTSFLEARTRAETMAARDRFDRGKDATRIKLRELEGRLKGMLAENEQLPESEQLARDEFVLNVAWRDNLLTQHAARAQRAREGIARDLARMAIVRERMKLSSVFRQQLPMRRQTPHEQQIANKVAMLRLVEFSHHQQEVREGHSSDVRTRFQETIPSDLQWVLNAGSLHPKLQIGTSCTDAEVSEYAKLPSFHSVYHPAAVRTRKQARVQMHLLSCYARELRNVFNAEFQELVRHKENTMEQIEAKNARIMEITAELNVGNAGDLFKPHWASEERADSILKVVPEEMTQKPYETTERRKQREREAQEAAEKEKARKKDDVGGRALMDMMDGTLEVRKDPLAAQELVKEAWMLTIQPEEMTAEQKKLVAQFEAAQAKFEEEKEKYRKSLDLELRKTRGEVIDLCRAFDEKLRALRDRYTATHRAVLAQELYELRLGEELMAREQGELETERLKEDARKMQDIEARAKAESDRFAAQLEACREAFHRATEEDKVLEKSFMRELEEMVQSGGSAGGGTPTASTSQLDSPEFTKHLVELYRKRKPDDLVPARDGASGHDSTKRTPSAGTAAHSKGSAKQRLLAESQSGGGGSSRSLLVKQSSSKNNIESEANLDPFQHLDSQQRGNSRRGSFTGVETGSEKLVVAPLDYVADRPEGVLIEDRVWRALNALRAKKILAEHAVREKTELLTLAKAGQDESPVGNSGDDALLVARTSVEALNDVIQLHGKDQVGILGRIKDFRKSINVMEWEHALLELQARDMDERYTDIQLLRVTKDLQELFHTGDTSHKQKREAAMLEAKLAHLGRHHQATLLKLERTGSHLERQLRERERENQNFQQQVARLETQVQIREDILASRTSAAMRQKANGGARGDTTKLKAIAVRRKLVDLAKAQTDEIEYLRLELDKMRRPKKYKRLL
ncbi:WD40-repeat-containing domain [Phytophthora cactorum]|nr:WD40-repeat-containing domain [Phytophthora cactorum]